METLVTWAWLATQSLAWALIPTAVLVLALLALAWWQGWGWRSLWALPLAAGIMVAVWLAYGLLLSQQAPPRPATVGLRVAHLNMYYANQHTAAVLQFAKTSQAELVSVQEASQPLLAELTNISGTYPHQKTTQTRLPMALLSIYPLTRAQAWGDRAVLYHVGRPADRGGAFYVLQIHPQSPYRPEALAQRNEKLAELSRALPNLPRPLLVVGDFNTVPWDNALQPFQPQLTLAGGWRAWLPSFPTWLPVTPLDHVWASPHWPLATLQRVRVAGADHLGLVVDF